MVAAQHQTLKRDERVRQAPTVRRSFRRQTSSPGPLQGMRAERHRLPRMCQLMNDRKYLRVRKKGGGESVNEGVPPRRAQYGVNYRAYRPAERRTLGHRPESGAEAILLGNFELVVLFINIAIFDFT